MVLLGQWTGFQGWLGTCELGRLDFFQGHNEIHINGYRIKFSVGIYDTVTKGAKMYIRQTFDYHIFFTMN